MFENVSKCLFYFLGYSSTCNKRATLSHLQSVSFPSGPPLRQEQNWIQMSCPPCNTCYLWIISHKKKDNEKKNSELKSFFLFWKKIKDTHVFFKHQHSPLCRHHHDSLKMNEKTTELFSLHTVNRKKWCGCWCWLLIEFCGRRSIWRFLKR